MICSLRLVKIQPYYYDIHEQLGLNLSDFVVAYNFARRLKTLSNLTTPNSLKFGK